MQFLLTRVYYYLSSTCVYRYSISRRIKFMAAKYYFTEFNTILFFVCELYVLFEKKNDEKIVKRNNLMRLPEHK